MQPVRWDPTAPIPPAIIRRHVREITSVSLPTIADLPPAAAGNHNRNVLLPALQPPHEQTTVLPIIPVRHPAVRKITNEAESFVFSHNKSPYPIRSGFCIFCFVVESCRQSSKMDTKSLAISSHAAHTASQRSSKAGSSVFHSGCCSIPSRYLRTP